MEKMLRVVENIVDKNEEARGIFIEKGIIEKMREVDGGHKYFKKSDE